MRCCILRSQGFPYWSDSWLIQSSQPIISLLCEAPLLTWHCLPFFFSWEPFIFYSIYIYFFFLSLKRMLWGVEKENRGSKRTKLWRQVNNRRRKTVRKWGKWVSKHGSSVEKNVIVNDWFAAFIYSKNISWFSSITTFLMDDRCLFKDKGKWPFF